MTAPSPVQAACRVPTCVHGSRTQFFTEMLVPERRVEVVSRLGLDAIASIHHVERALRLVQAVGRDSVPARASDDVRAALEEDALCVRHDRLDLARGDGQSSPPVHPGEHCERLRPFALVSVHLLDEPDPAPGESTRYPSQWASQYSVSTGRTAASITDIRVSSSGVSAVVPGDFTLAAARSSVAPLIELRLSRSSSRRTAPPIQLRSGRVARGRRPQADIPRRPGTA